MKRTTAVAVKCLLICATLLFALPNMLNANEPPRTNIVLFLIGTILMTLLIPPRDNHIITCFTACIASFANIGPGFADVGATQNYAFIPGAGKIILALLMIIGRLELFTALVLFVPAFWKK